MIVKYGSAKIAGIATTSREFRREFGVESFVKFSTLHKLDTDRYLYIRNHSVSEHEHYGPNENGDAFPKSELEVNYKTFLGQRVSLDHQENSVIGSIVSTKYIPWQESIKNGGFVENILAIDKEKAEEQFPGLINLILGGKITDTSMGALVKFTTCSFCGNVAENEDEYCEHVRDYKMKDIVLASGEKYKIYEICHGVSFFEDSVIVPLHLGGKAGGEGADTKAKILQIIASKKSSFDEPSDLLETIENSLPRAKAEAFMRDLDEALSSPNPTERAIFVIIKYSSYVDRRGERALRKLASMLR